MPLRTLALVLLLSPLPLLAEEGVARDEVEAETASEADSVGAGEAAEEPGGQGETPPTEGEEPLPPGMTRGPATVSIGANAEFELPEGAVFGDAKVTKEMLERSGNLTSGRELGIVLNGESSVIFEFDEVGYIKDDDKDSLDAEKMLSTMREGQEEANKELKRLGRPMLELPRWQVKPHYDAQTHNLEWAPVVRNIQSGSETVNYNVRVLGRRGVMEVTLLVKPDKLDAELPAFRGWLNSFRFVAGEDYAAFRSGDKVAEYGLAALVTGGAVAVGLKSGLFAKFWKFIVVGLVALGGLVKRLFGGSKSPPPQQPSQDDSAANE